jgi:hypothetical protein
MLNKVTKLPKSRFYVFCFWEKNKNCGRNATPTKYFENMGGVARLVELKYVHVTYGREGAEDYFMNPYYNIILIFLSLIR